MKKPGEDVAKITTKPVKNEVGGMPCPRCGALIEMSLETLLVRRAFTCPTPSCRTTLRLDTDASKDSLAVMRKVKQETLRQKQ